MESCIINPYQTKHKLNDIEVISNNNAFVSKITQFILPDEAKYLMDKAHSLGLHKSTVVGDNGEMENSPGRTSSTAFLPKNEDDIITCIENRISAIANESRDKLEPLQVTLYKKKEKYDSHHDWFHDIKPGDGQRTKTVFTYLKGLENDGGEICGGATAFPKLKNENNEVLRVYPVSGDAVMWSNVTFDGNGNDYTLHGGEEVLCEGATKFGLNAWFRDTKW